MLSLELEAETGRCDGICVFWRLVGLDWVGGFHSICCIQYDGIYFAEEGSVKLNSNG